MIHVYGFTRDRLFSTVCERAHLAALAAKYNGVYQTVYVRELPNGTVRVLSWKGTFA